ncbi:MAG: glycosyltransferase family 2 protein [Acidimicrobiales bacterium]
MQDHTSPPFQRSIVALLAIHNRAELTRRCLTALRAAAEVARAEISIVVVDDGSTDSTPQMLAECLDPRTDRRITGSGSLYWAGAMRMAMASASDLITHSDHVLLLNNDVRLYTAGLISLLERDPRREKVVVGTLCDPVTGAQTYGGHRRKNRFRPLTFEMLSQSAGAKVDAMNANAVLVGLSAWRRIGAFDALYVHQFADYDYALRANRLGVEVELGSAMVGTCVWDHPWPPAYEDPDLSVGDRLRALRDPKGLPPRQWRHYVLTHGGLLAPRYIFGPYLRALLGIPYRPQLSACGSRSRSTDAGYSQSL